MSLVVTPSSTSAAATSSHQPLVPAPWSAACGAAAGRRTASGSDRAGESREAGTTGDGYTAGPATLAAAHAFLVTNPLSVLSQSTLQQLAVSTGLTASMCVRVEDSRVLIARVESDEPLNYVLPVGERLPLYLGGAGKTILADMTGDELDAQLDKIRSDGYAISISERLYGIASVTAPVRAPDDTLVGVLGVTGDAANDFTDNQIAQLIPEVRRAATALGERLPAV